MRALLLSMLLVGCHRELDVPECAYQGGCADTASMEETATDSIADGGEDSSAADAPIDTADACECSPGEIAPVTGTCPGVLEKKTKTCTSSCTWGAETCALPKGWTAIADSPIEGRIYASSVWTGGELIVFGGGTATDGSGGTIFSDGAIYRVAKNEWQTLPTTTLLSGGRVHHTAVWRGIEMIVFGGRSSSGYRNDGAIYDSYSNSWLALPAAPLAARAHHGAITTGPAGVMIVWGGGDDTTQFADGAIYDPSALSWTKMPAAPIAARTAPVMVWTGKHVLIWGGRGAAGELDDGALFDPATKSWTALPPSGTAARLWPAVGVSATHFLFFGGFRGELVNSGAVLSLTTPPSWSAITAPTTAMFEPAFWPVSWYAGDKLTVWSGGVPTTSDLAFQKKGAIYDRSTASWTPLDVTGAPAERGLAVSAWTGAYVVVWSGLGRPGGGITERLKSGALYVP